MVPADGEDEAHEVTRLLVEAERVQGPEAEGRVADPAVAVVPVAFAARRLRQRGGRRGDDRPGRVVGQPLQHQRRALQVDPPGVVGEFAVAQPEAPEVVGQVEPLLRLGRAARPARLHLAPVQRAVGAFAVVQGLRPAQRVALDDHRQIAAHLDLGAFRAGRDTCAARRVVPDRVAAPVVEARPALHLDVDFAVDAGRPSAAATGRTGGRRSGCRSSASRRRSRARRGRAASRCR